jgi:hypothetical protein
MKDVSVQYENGTLAVETVSLDLTIFLAFADAPVAGMEGSIGLAPNLIKSVSYMD